MVFPVIFGQLLLDLNLSSLTQSASSRMAIFSFKRGCSMTVFFVCSFLFGAFRLLFTLRSFSVGGLSPYLLITPSSDYLLAVPEMRREPSGNCYKIKFLV
jgi:hypothetical protein